MSKLKKHWRILSACLIMALIGCTGIPATVNAPTNPSPALPTAAPATSVPTQAVATPRQPAPAQQPVSLKSNQPRIQAPQVNPNDLKALADGNAAFAVDLYQQLRAQKGNLFFSPYSISLALAMTEAGARGQTQSEMDKALHFTLPQARLHPAFNALDQAINEAGKEDASGSQGEGFKLNIANSIWGQNGYPFQQNYLDLLAENYGAGLRLADFKADPEGSRKTINGWVSEQTAQKIQDLIPQGAINELTRMVLANAIYFKASWLYPFSDEATQEAPFHLLDGGSVNVPMMHNSAHLSYAGGEGWQALEIPYSSQNFSMIVLLPDSGQFDSFEQSLDGKKVAEIIDSLQSTQVNVAFPKLKFEAEFALKDALSAMGMTTAFQPGQADFSGMADTNELYISSVIHKAFVAVDEKGTEAAAATAVMVGAMAAPTQPVNFTADRPFLFMIRENSTGTILFLGRVVNPS